PAVVQALLARALLSVMPCDYSIAIMLDETDGTLEHGEHYGYAAGPWVHAGGVCPDTAAFDALKTTSHMEALRQPAHVRGLLGLPAASEASAFLALPVYSRTSLSGW